jgi:hypothetical protein
MRQSTWDFARAEPETRELGLISGSGARVYNAKLAPEGLRTSQVG